MATVHNLPHTPAFRDEPPDSPISELALRVVVELPDWRLHVVGTATLLAGHLAVTARHVLEHALQTFGPAVKKDDGVEIGAFELKLYQVLPGPVYRLWRVATAWPCDTDVVLLHLALDRTSLPGEKIAWKQPRLRVLPPPPGQHVVAFGYRQGQITVTEGEDGQHHIVLNDRPTTSMGVVRQVYPAGRDKVMLPFPCFEIEARFDPGMSGGMVVDETGALCGLICASLQHGDLDAPPISYVASLWPMLKTVISGDRGDRYPRGVSYPLIDLAVDGIIAVNDLHALNPKDFPGTKWRRDV
jgi:trypsin-like peptidase